MLSRLLIGIILLGVNALAAPSFTGEVNHRDGLYATNEEAVFTITREAPSDELVTINLLRNNKDLVQSAIIPAGEKSTTLRISSPSPDWFVCSTTPAGEKKPVEIIGIVSDASRYQPSAPTPADFEDFWAAQKAQLAAEKAEPAIAPLTKEQRDLELKKAADSQRVDQLESEGYTVANLEIPCLNVKPLRGYFALPPQPKTGGHPAVLFFRAAGVEGDWCRASYINALNLSQKYNAIVVDINAHGMLNGQPQDYYAALAKGELANYQTLGRESRDTFYFLGMFLRALRAVDFVASRPEWDGRNIICIGTSQGGAQALAAAGLDSRVTVVSASVPGNCDITGRLALRPSSWPGDGGGDPASETTKRILETVRYFDNVNFCARSRAATFMTVGLIDTTCPPPGIFAAYNQLQSAKQIVSIPSGGHRALSSQARDIQKQQDDFILKHLLP